MLPLESQTWRKVTGKEMFFLPTVEIPYLAKYATGTFKIDSSIDHEVGRLWPNNYLAAILTYLFQPYV